MLEALRSEFEARFRRRPVWGARAPGRVNLIGEHTDYNDGLVLPCAIDRDTIVLAAPRDDARFRVYSRERAEERSFDARRLAPEGAWSDFAQGVVRALEERGAKPRGLDLAIASQVPPESGLSSSAALGLALATALDAAFEVGLGAEERARVAHRAETGFVGVACGIMDPFACALGRRDAALRIDCRSLEVRAVPLPRDGVSLLVAHSGVRRALAGGGYGERVQQCADALARARSGGAAPGAARALRDVPLARLPQLERALPPLLFRRVRHVLTENERVDATCAALGRGDFADAGAQLRDGMTSLRDDYEVSTPELDALCELADAQEGVYGSRLTGAGFGGCTLHLVAPEAAARAAEAIAAGFAERFGRRPPILTARPADGASLLDL